MLYQINTTHCCQYNDSHVRGKKVAVFLWLSRYRSERDGDGDVCTST